MGFDTGPLARVAAVVVTYRRPRLATSVVRSLLDDEGLAPERIHLVVNGEGGLADEELEKRIHVVRLHDNIGPAGGFRVGMLAATEAGDVDWIYLCEDDISLFDLPTPRLARVVADVERHSDAAGVPVGAVVAYGRDLHRLTGHTSVHRVAAPEGFDEVDAASWGATLVSRRVVDAGILPDDAYFFGYEDFDFFYRMRAAGFGLLVDRASVVSASAHQSLDGRDTAFAGQRPVDAEEPWRAYYVARNFFLLARRYGQPTWIAAHLAYSARRWQLARSAAERAAVVRGLVDGVRGRTGKDPRFVRRVGELDRSPASPRRVPRSARRKRLVLHLLPNDVARGGQAIARDLRAGLDRPEEEHRILTFFRSEPPFLEPDYCLGLEEGRLRQGGFDPRVTLRLRRALDLLRPTVVVAHGGEPLKYAATAMDGRVPLVYFAFGIATEAARRGPRRALYESLMGRADVVAAISLETAEEAQQVFGVPKSRLVLLPNSRDPSVYLPSKEATRDGGDGDVTLAFVGHLTATKRPERFVALVRELRQRGRPVRGVLVGDGPLEADIRDEAKGCGVEVLGRRMDVPAILSRSDAFVFTSVPESEGMPGVLIEAGMAGLPVVATATPGASTVIEEGVTGHVVPFDDFEALVEATERLVVDPELRGRMGEAARRRCEGCFSLDVVHRGWRTLLDSLVPAPLARDPSEEP